MSYGGHMPKEKNYVDDIIKNVSMKLRLLQNRIDVKQTSKMKHIDRKWVEIQLEDVQAGIVFDKELMLKANDMWRKYETR